MKNISFSYDITINFEISKEDFDLLCEAFNSHHEVKRYIDSSIIDRKTKKNIE